MAEFPKGTGLRAWHGAARAARYAAFAVAAAGVILMASAPFLGPALNGGLYLIEPLLYIGAILLVAGLAAFSALYAIAERFSPPPGRNWSRVTQDYFDTFSHDMGRPLRRILGKARDVRARLEESGKEHPAAVLELIDEIEQHAPSFRLMLANVRVLVELEDESAVPKVEPLDPAAIVRNIVDRYAGVAADKGAEVTWWAEPPEFGLVYGDPAALDHIITNLVDNAVKFCSGHVEVRLTRNPSHYLIRVWDDGPGIQETYVPHVFDRGWTPDVAARREKTSSGLGLFIARTLAKRAGGEIAIETVTGQAAGHHTSMTVMLPMVRPRQQA
jgi:signal transduction histidine kinase